MKARARGLRFGVAIALVAALLTATALASGPRPIKEWKGFFTLYGNSVTVREFPHGKIDVTFTAGCSGSRFSAAIKTVAEGKLVGSRFTATSLKLTPSGFTAPGWKLSGKIGASTVTGSATVSYQKNSGSCTLSGTFSATRLKKIPKS